MSIGNKTLDEVKKIIDESWLGLGDTTKIDLTSPLLIKSKEPFYVENPHFLYLEYFRDPAYFSAICKHFLNFNLIPFQQVILQELWYRPFPMLIASRGGGKSSILAIYAILRAFLDQGSKVVIVGSNFRQSKLVFEYILERWNNSPLLRSCCEDIPDNGPRVEPDRLSLRIGQSIISALPIGTGAGIRGTRATHLIVEEFSAHNEEIFDVVLAGFGAVSKSPDENVKAEARRDTMMEMGLWNEDEELKFVSRASNQTIISGTATYHFNHFHKHWNRYREIVSSRGDTNKLEQVFNGDVPEGLNWKDFSIIRLPAELLPKGFLDKKNIAKSKATATIGTYSMEYGGVFSSDSTGFYRRSLIESCVTKQPIELPHSGRVQFDAMLKGNIYRRYVYGIDPASERDNLAVVILELWPDHNRIVHVWTTNNKIHKEKLKDRLTQEHNYFNYVVRKMRDLMRTFPPERIGIDAQGGGNVLREIFRDVKTLHAGEQPLLPVMNPDKPQETDALAGSHILEFVQFSDGKWVAAANHDMKKDLESKALLFPYFDPLSIGLAVEEDRQMSRGQDTLEDCIIEIEDLKDELVTIVQSQTPGGRERWDTPELKIEGAKKDWQRKDRYSALLIANSVGRGLRNAPEPIIYESVGGFAGNVKDEKARGPMFVGPAWFVEAMEGVYD